MRVRVRVGVRVRARTRARARARVRAGGDLVAKLHRRIERLARVRVSN